MSVIADYDTKFSKIEANLLLLKWMVGLVIIIFLYGQGS
ncbi:hypothetical protein SPONL_1833 [uncultured Candidatus Thioglobus sp.]|nr:hypothetical protein SPONL_1833 [uncultured Candidatus Thioglobus sp.]